MFMAGFIIHNLQGPVAIAKFGAKFRLLRQSSEVKEGCRVQIRYTVFWKRRGMLPPFTMDCDRGPTSGGSKFSAIQQNKLRPSSLKHTFIPPKFQPVLTSLIQRQHSTGRFFNSHTHKTVMIRCKILCEQLHPKLSVQDSLTRLSETQRRLPGLRNY